MVDSVLDVVSISLASTLLGLGVFLSSSVFKLIDLTCEPSFALGGCVYGVLIVFGVNPVLALIIVMFLGCLAGILTAAFINYIKLNSVVASMITLGCVQSLLTRLISLEHINGVGANSLLGSLSSGSNLIIALLVVGFVAFLFYRLMLSERGLAMRVYGDGTIITESMGIDGVQTLNLGLGISNMLCAIAGALTVQIAGRFAPQMSNGCFIFGISAIILGERIFNTRSISGTVCATFVGAMIYQIALKIFTAKDITGIGEEYNSVILALTLIFLIALKETHNQILDRDNFGRI